MSSSTSNVRSRSPIVGSSLRMTLSVSCSSFGFGDASSSPAASICSICFTLSSFFVLVNPFHQAENSSSMISPSPSLSICAKASSRSSWLISKPSFSESVSAAFSHSARSRKPLPSSSSS